MPERTKMTLALTKPRAFTWETQDGQKTGYEFTSIQGEQFNAFDGALVKAFDEANLAGKEQVYTVSLPDDPKKKPTVIGIEGVYAKQGGGYGRGGGMSDRQVALLAAGSATDTAQPEAILALADQLLPWLNQGQASGGGQEAKTGQAGEPADSGATPSESEDKPEQSPAPAVTGGEDGAKELLELAGMVPSFEGKPRLQEVFLSTKAKAYGKQKLDELSAEEQGEIASELARMAAES